MLRFLLGAIIFIVLFNFGIRLSLILLAPIVAVGYPLYPVLISIYLAIWPLHLHRWPKAHKDRGDNIFWIVFELLFGEAKCANLSAIHPLKSQKRNISAALLQFSEEKNYKPISRVLYCIATMAIIYLRCGSRQHLYLPTHAHRASSPQSYAYWAFQHARFTPIYCYQQIA